MKIEKLKKQLNKFLKMLPLVLGCIIAPLIVCVSLDSNIRLRRNKNTLYLGSGLAIASFGEDGDAYIDSKTNNSYQKQDNEWNFVENILNNNNGFSYNLYRKINRSYKYDLNQWIEDYKNDSLSLTHACRIDFDSNGGSRVESQMVVRNAKINEPSKPIKTGVSFVHWTCNGFVWDFNKDTAYISVCFVAEWK